MTIFNKLFRKKTGKTDEKPVVSSTLDTYRDPNVINERDLYTKEEWQERQQIKEKLREAEKRVAEMPLEERIKISRDFWGKYSKPDPDSGQLKIESHIEEDEEDND